MSDSSQLPEPAGRAAEIGPANPPKSPSSRNTPPLQEQEGEDAPSDGPNLFIAYGLIAFALLAAMALAALIVWPYYKAR